MGLPKHSLWHGIRQFLIIKGTYIQKLQEPTNSPVIKIIISPVVAAIVDSLGLIIK
jgi:hypothetical protein